MSNMWTPLDDPSCVCWFDFRDMEQAGLILDGGGAIEQITSKVGAHVAVQPTGSFRPMPEATGALFNDDQLPVSSLLCTGSGYLFGAGTTQINSSSAGRLLSLRQTGRSSDFGSLDSFVALYRANLLSADVGCFMAGDGRGINVPRNAGIGSEQYVVISRASATGISVGANGDWTTELAKAVALDTTDGMLIGQSLASNNEYWHGVVSDVFITADDSQETRQLYEGWLAHRMGVQASPHRAVVFPGNHQR